MSAMTKGDFPAITPAVYGARINDLRGELLRAFEYAAAHPVGGEVLLDWIEASVAQGRTFTGLSD